MGSIRKKKGWWYYRYYENGKQKEIALHTQNEEMAKRLKAILDTNTSQRKQINAKLGYVIEQYLLLLSSQKPQRTFKEYQLYAKRAKPLYGMLIREIKIQHIVDLLNSLESNLARETVRRTVMFLKQVFRWALKQGFITINPIEDFKYSVGKKTRRVRWFTQEELLRIFNYADEHYPQLSSLFKFLYYTGMRLSEMLALQWQDIDLHNKIINVYDSKTPSGYRQIPIRPEVEKILKQFPKCKETNFVFINKRCKVWNHDYIIHQFKHILRKVGIDEKGVCVHTLRHTFASHLAMAGVPLDVIRDLLGHGSVLITEIYAHLAPDHLKNAVDKLPNLEE